MKDTKTEIVELATNLILERGFNAFSYADIAKALQIKNAAVHYHFPTKEDLGVAVMKQQQSFVKTLIHNLKVQGVSEIGQLMALIDIYNGCVTNKLICALGSMGSDVLTLSERVQVEIKNDYVKVWEWVSQILEAGKDKNLFRFEGQASTKAAMILNNLMAGAIVARVLSPQHFKDVIAQMVAELLV